MKNLFIISLVTSSKIEIEFRHTEDQFNVIQNQLDRFDDNIVSISKALFASTQIPSHYLWRKPIVVNWYIQIILKIIGFYKTIKKTYLVDAKLFKIIN